MKTATKPSTMKRAQAGRAAPVQAAAAKTAAATRRNAVSGEVVVADMRAFRAKIAADPRQARDLLVRIGAMTKTGKLKTLIRA